MNKAVAGAVGTLAVLLGAAPAMAGGYWDADGADAPFPPSPSPACDCPPPPCPGWSGARVEESWARPQAEQVTLSPDFFEGGGGVGPAYVDEGESGGGYVIAVGDAGAAAFASASARASVSVRIRGRAGRFRGHGMHGWSGGDGRW